MKFEHSAGGVIISNKSGQLQVLLLKDKGGKWTFPKGLVEKGENEVAAAKREIGEEVGIKRLKLLNKIRTIDYMYKWEGQFIKKTVTYYLFQNHGQKSLHPQHEEGIMAVKWYPLNEALKIIGYPRTNKLVLEEAFKFLNYVCPENAKQ